MILRIIESSAQDLATATKLTSVNKSTFVVEKTRTPCRRCRRLIKAPHYPYRQAQKLLRGFGGSSPLYHFHKPCRLLRHRQYLCYVQSSCVRKNCTKAVHQIEYLSCEKNELSIAMRVVYEIARLPSKSGANFADPAHEAKAFQIVLSTLSEQAR